MSGNFKVRLARSKSEIHAAQRLRYRVFYEEMGGKPSLLAWALKRDFDRFDAFCDHLILMDNEKIIGTYRLLKQTKAGFYSAQFFDLAPLFAKHPTLTFLELGRSCLDKNYRNKGALALLWAGVWDYVRAHKIDVMFGCASFPLSDTISPELNYLPKARAEWAVKAKGKVVMRDNVPPKLPSPPLIRAYLKAGAQFSDEAVFDPQFKTIDVFVVMPILEIHAKHIAYFSKLSQA